MRYEHTQTGRLSLILGLLAVAFAALIALPLEEPTFRMVFAVLALVFLPLALCFHTLTTRVDDEALSITFGPIPLFRKRVPLRHVRSATVARSNWIDGWGVHFVPRRGWTWNIRGFACVQLRLAVGGTLRVGTDDPDGLAEALRTATDLTETTETSAPESS